MREFPAPLPSPPECNGRAPVDRGTARWWGCWRGEVQGQISALRFGRRAALVAAEIQPSPGHCLVVGLLGTSPPFGDGSWCAWDLRDFAPELFGLAPVRGPGCGVGVEGIGRRPIGQCVWVIARTFYRLEACITLAILVPIRGPGCGVGVEGIGVPSSTAGAVIFAFARDVAALWREAALLPP